MSTRQIVGTIRRPDNDQAWSAARVTFRLVRPFATATGTRATRTTEIAAQDNGSIDVALAVPDDATKAARYELRIEADGPYYFDLSAGATPIQLETLVAATMTPPTASTGLAELIAAERAARIAADAALAQQIAAIEPSGDLGELTAQLEAETAARQQADADLLDLIDQPHTHDLANGASAGFMSPAQVIKLASAAATNTAQTWSERQTFSKQTTIQGEADGYALIHKRADGPNLFNVDNEGRLSGGQRGYVWIDDNLQVSAGKRVSFGGGAIDVYGSGNSAFLSNGARYNTTSGAWERTINGNYLPQIKLLSSGTDAQIELRTTDNTTDSNFISAIRWSMTTAASVQQINVKTSLQERTGSRDTTELTTATDAQYTTRRRIELARSGQLVEAMRIDTESSATQTGLAILHDGTLKRIETGPADSAGAGYRSLRVTN